MRDKLKLLLEIIVCPSAYAEKVLHSYDVWASEQDGLGEENARKLLAEGKVFADQPKTMMLLLYIALEQRSHGAWSRLPEDIFWDTMRAFTLYVEFYQEATGEYGFGKASWPLLITDAKKFRLGTLEYELEVRDGKREISMHIPKDAKLTPESITDSLKKEKVFMREYFPEWAELPHSCESWLLSPVLKEMLSQESRIRWFQSLFDIKSFNPDEILYLEYLFKLEYFQYSKTVDFQTLKEDTSLQRAMKQFVLKGGKPGSALGYLKNEYMI